MAMRIFLSMMIALVALMTTKTIYYVISYLSFYIKYQVLGLEYKPSGEAKHYYKVINEEMEGKVLVKYNEKGQEVFDKED